MSILDKTRVLRGSLDSHAKEVVSGAAVAFFLKALGAALAFLFNIVIARELGAEGTGVFYMALTVFNIAAVLGTAGLDSAMLRFTSSNAAAGDWAGVRGVCRNGALIAVIAGSAASIVMFLCAPLAARLFHNEEVAGIVRILSFAVMPMALLVVNAGALNGLKRIRDSQIVYGAAVPGISLLLFYSAARALGVEGAAWSYILAVFAACALGFVFYGMAAKRYGSVKGSFDTGRLIRTSMPFFLVSAMHLVNGWANIILLGIFSTPEDVAVFNAALRTSMLASLVLLAVNAIASPKFSALYGQSDTGNLRRVAVGSTRLTVLAAAPMLIFFLMFPAWVLGLFGESFRAGAAALVILTLGQIINTATGSTGQMLAMTGHELALRNIIAASAALNVVLNLVFIPVWGINGAAVATAINVAVSTLLASYSVHARLGIRMDLFTRLERARS
ncbi:MAG TPA: flippase [Thermodesulfobacteriota bacterium]